MSNESIHKTYCDEHGHYFIWDQLQGHDPLSWLPVTRYILYCRQCGATHIPTSTVSVGTTTLSSTWTITYESIP